jgi:hypothetical protein
MAQIGETPVVGTIRGSERHIAAVSGDAPEDVLTRACRQGPDDDPLRIISTHWGLSLPDHDDSIGRP